MGNTKSQKLKDSFLKGKYMVKESRKDQLLGMYTVLQFNGFESDLYIQKVLNPAEYDEYADINEFIKKLSTNSKNICEFHFVEYSSTNQELFDLVFEFGTLLKLPFATERQLWALVDNVIEAMLFLEENVMHYPFLHKNYIVETSRSGYKLINPYCFPDYLKEVLQVYMNPMTSVTNRKSYSQTQIRRNIREFGVMIITMVQSHSVQRLLKEPNYWQEVLVNLRSKISNDLENLIAYILQAGPNSPKSFADIKNWIVSFKPKADKKKLNIFSGLLETPKKPVDQPAISVNRAEVVNTPRDQYPYNSTPHGKDKTDTDLRNNSGPNNLSQFYKNELSVLMNNSSNIPSNNIIKANVALDPFANYNMTSQTPVKNFLKNQTNQQPLIDHNNKPKNFEFVNHSPAHTQDMNVYFQNHNMTPGRVNVPHNLTDSQRIELAQSTAMRNFQGVQEVPVPRPSSQGSWPELPDVNFNAQGRRLTLSNQNTPPGYNTNSTQLLQQNGHMSITQRSQDKQNSVDGQQQSHTSQQPGKPALLQSVLEPNPHPSQSPVKPPLSLRNPESLNPELSLNPSFQNSPVKQPTPVETLKTDKKVQKVLIKWIREENRYQKTLEYTDGTSEAVNMDADENKQYESYTSQVPEKPKPQVPFDIDDKKSHMGNYDIQGSYAFNTNTSGFITNTTNQAIITLQRSCQEPPLLLFKAPVRTDTSQYKHLTTVVDQSNAMKPSMYHQHNIDFSQESVNMVKSSHNIGNFVGSNQQMAIQSTPRIMISSSIMNGNGYGPNGQPRMVLPTKFIS